MTLPTNDPAVRGVAIGAALINLEQELTELRVAADRLCVAIEGRVPFEPGPWNAYWELRYLLDGKNPDGSGPT